MESNIKEFIKIETREKEIVDSKKFDEVYYYFDMLIDLDIEVATVEGIGDMLPKGLNILAADQITQSDIPVSFAIIVKCFEPFVKKLLYILDREQYKMLTNHKEPPKLPEILKALGLDVFVSKEKRNKRTDSIYYTYELRNIDAHECRKWSKAKLYFELQHILSAYLIVVDTNLEKIKNKLVGNDIIKNIEFSAFDINVFKCAHPQDIILFLRLGVIELTESIESIIEEDDLFRHTIRYDNNLRRINEMSIIKDSKLEYSYEYEEEGKLTVTRIRKDNTDSFTNDEISKFSYTKDDLIKEVIVYRQKRGSFEKECTYLFNYLPDGGFTITIKKTRNDYNGQEIITQETIYEYYNNGLIKSVKTKNRSSIYEYDNNYILRRIIDRQNGIEEIKYIEDQQVYYRKNPDESDCHVIKKCIYDEKGRLLKEIYNKGATGTYTYITK